MILIRNASLFFIIRHLLDLNQWNIALQAIALPLCQDAIATYDRDARIQAPRIGTNPDSGCYQQEGLILKHYINNAHKIRAIVGQCLLYFSGYGACWSSTKTIYSRTQPLVFSMSLDFLPTTSIPSL